MFVKGVNVSVFSAGHQVLVGLGGKSGVAAEKGWFFILLAH